MPNILGDPVRNIKMCKQMFTKYCIQQVTTAKDKTILILKIHQI